MTSDPLPPVRIPTYGEGIQLGQALNQALDLIKAKVPNQQHGGFYGVFPGELYSQISRIRDVFGVTSVVAQHLPDQVANPLLSPVARAMEAITRAGTRTDP